MPDPLSDYTRRPARYDLLDGTGELSFGIVMLGFALAGRLCAGLPMPYWLLAIYSVIAALWAVCHYGTRYVRSRLTWRRSGYITSRKRPWIWTALLAFVVAFAAALYVFRFQSSPLSVPLLFGLVMSAIFAVNALRFRARRFVVLAAVSAAFGVGLQFLQPAPIPGMFWYVVLLSITMLITGAITLYRYARRMPPANLEAE